jgi:hypothetical protein
MSSDDFISRLQLCGQLKLVRKLAAWMMVVFILNIVTYVIAIALACLSVWHMSLYVVVLAAILIPASVVGFVSAVAIRIRTDVKPESHQN